MQFKLCEIDLRVSKPMYYVRVILLLYLINQCHRLVNFQKAVLDKFFEHILEVKPNIFVTYNGDSFDW